MPRGIVGSERGGILTNQVKDNPYTVVLLDEIEKADTYVHNLFLQVFDEGWLTDGRGKKVYFSDTIIIIDEQLVSEELSRLSRPMDSGRGSGDFEPVRKAVLKAAEDRFTPGVHQPLDDIVVFAAPVVRRGARIASIYLDSIRKMMAPTARTLEVSDAALSPLARTGFSVKYGARFLKRGIDEKVKMPVTPTGRNPDRFYVEEIDGRAGRNNAEGDDLMANDREEKGYKVIDRRSGEEAGGGSRSSVGAAAGPRRVGNPGAGAGVQEEKSGAGKGRGKTGPPVPRPRGVAPDGRDGQSRAAPAPGRQGTAVNLKEAQNIIDIWGSCRRRPKGTSRKKRTGSCGKVSNLQLRMAYVTVQKATIPDLGGGF